MKINKKTIGTTSLDGAIFSLSLKVQYSVNDNEYVEKKIVAWDGSLTQVGQDVIVSYNEDKPQKILSLRRK